MNLSDGKAVSAVRVASAGSESVGASKSCFSRKKRGSKAFMSPQTSR